jgi:putative FmdB family regulatory protein
MPTYDFICPICNKIEEKFFSVYSNHTTFCDVCKVEMEKTFQPTPVHFKGTGFYKTGG